MHLIDSYNDQTSFQEIKDRFKSRLRNPSMFSPVQIFEAKNATFQSGKNQLQWRKRLQQICHALYDDNRNLFKSLNTYLINIPARLSRFFSQAKLGRLITQSQSTEKNINIVICSKFVKTLEELYNYHKKTGIETAQVQKNIQEEYIYIVWEEKHHEKLGQFNDRQEEHRRIRDKDLCTYMKMILKIIKEFERLKPSQKDHLLNFVTRKVNFLIDDFKAKIIRYKQQLQNQWEQFYTFVSPEEMYKKFREHYLKNVIIIESKVDAQEKIQKDTTEIYLRMPHETKEDISDTIDRIIEKINEVKDHSEYLPHLEKIQFKRASHMTDEQNERLFKAIFGMNYKRNFQLRFNHPMKSIYLANDQDFNCKSIHHFMINPKFAKQKQKPQLNFNPTIDYRNDSRDFFERIAFFGDVNFPTKAIPLIQCQDYVRQFRMKTVIMPLEAFDPTSGKQQKIKRRQSRLSSIVRACSELQHLYIGELTGLIDTLPEQAKIFRPNNEQKIDTIPFLQYNFQFLKNLKTLVLYSVKITQESFDILRDYDHLDTFALINCIETQKLNFQKVFQKKNKLKNLIIDMTIGYSYLNFDSILYLKSLETLVIRHYNSFLQEQPKDDASKPSFAELINLTYLVVEHTNFIREDTVKEICQLSKLKHLNIRNGGYNGHKWIEHFNDHLQNLETLVLGNEQQAYDVSYFHRAVQGKNKLRKLGLPEIDYKLDQIDTRKMTQQQQVKIDNEKKNRINAAIEANNVLENIQYLKIQINQQFYLNKILCTNLYKLKFVTIQEKNKRLSKLFDEQEKLSQYSEKEKEKLRQYSEKSYLGTSAKLSLYVDKRQN